MKFFFQSETQSLIFVLGLFLQPCLANSQGNRAEDFGSSRSKTNESFETRITKKIEALEKDLSTKLDKDKYYAFIDGTAKPLLKTQNRHSEKIDALEKSRKDERKKITTIFQEKLLDLEKIRSEFESGSRTVLESHQQTIVTAVLEDPKFEGVRKALKDEIKKEILSELGK